MEAFPVIWGGVMKEKEPVTGPPNEARAVLIVEDEPRLREMLARAVREMGFNPAAVSTAEAALRAIEQRPADILILDLNLPGMNGMELLEQLHARQPDVQVIILTGFGDLEAAKRAIRLNVVDFLTKPCALGALEEAIDRARRRRFKTIRPELPEPDLEPESEPVRQFQIPDPADRSMSLEELEQRHILAVLEKNQGNRSATAAELGISLRKLYYRLGEYQKQGLIP